MTISYDGHANDGDEAPKYSTSSSPKPSTFPADLAKNTAIPPETGAPDLLSAPHAKKTSMAPETHTGAPDLSTPVAPSPPDKEHTSCESTSMCSTSIKSAPSVPPALQSNSERSEPDDSLGEDEPDEVDSNEDNAEEDDSGDGESDEDDSDGAETVVSSTSGSAVPSTPQARADSQVPQHILDNWASSSSSSSAPQARADSQLPEHIVNNWVSCSSSCSSSASSSSSSSSSSSTTSSECSEDSDEEGGTRSSEEVRVLSARREVLHQAEGVGFMASLSDMKNGVVTKGKRIGGGGSGEVFELEVVDCDLQEELLSFTVGAGVICKKFKKVSVILYE